MVEIKDIEMAKNCVECKLFHFYFDSNSVMHCICKFGNMEMCGGESAVDVIDADDNFCNDNCGIPAKDCWKRYFQQLMSRKKL